MRANSIAIITVGVLAGAAIGRLHSRPSAGQLIQPVTVTVPSVARPPVAVPNDAQVVTDSREAVEFPAANAGAESRQPLHEGTHWADINGELVPLQELSDDGILFIADNIIGRENLPDFPMLRAELMRRQFPTGPLSSDGTTATAPASRAVEGSVTKAIDDTPSKADSAQPHSDPPVRITPQSSRESNVAAVSRQRVLEYADQVAGFVDRGRLSMANYRRSLAVYRSFQSLKAVGNLQMIDNLAVVNNGLYDELETVVVALRTLTLSQDRLDFYFKKVTARHAEINENNQKIAREFDRIRFVTRRETKP